MLLRPGDMNRLVIIERPTSDDELDGAGSGSWAEVATIYASIEDVLPSRGEKLADGINAARRPAKVRIYWRDDVTPAMRFNLDGRLMQIVAGPAELGYREGLEFMVEDWTSAGNGA